MTAVEETQGLIEMIGFDYWELGYFGVVILLAAIIGRGRSRRRGEMPVSSPQTRTGLDDCGTPD